MSRSNDPAPPRERPLLEQRRRDTLRELESLHGRREIGAEEYRQRAEATRRATDEVELEALRPSHSPHGPRAVPPTPPVPPVPATPPAPPATAPAPMSERTLPEPGDETGFVFACMGGSIRKGAWEPPETLYSLALMGGVELDFREAALLEGTTEVVVLSIMGGTRITVPDDVDVEVNGIGLMGSFEHVSRHLPGPDRPLIRVRGLALMGGVTVKVKPAPRAGGIRGFAKRLGNLV